VIAIRDRTLADGVTGLLKAAGGDVMAFASSTLALSAIEKAVSVEVLVVGLDFPAGQPNGVSLANLARARRPEIKVVFVGTEDLAEYTSGIGQFVPLPVSAGKLAGVALALLNP
jgi:DNA-binding NarL/FixJ family response regulator